MPRGGPFAQGRGRPLPFPREKPRDRFCGPCSIATVPKCGTVRARPHTASGSLLHSMGSASQGGHGLAPGAVNAALGIREVDGHLLPRLALKVVAGQYGHLRPAGQGGYDLVGLAVLLHVAHQFRAVFPYQLVEPDGSFLEPVNSPRAGHPLGHPGRQGAEERPLVLYLVPQRLYARPQRPHVLKVLRCAVDAHFLAWLQRSNLRPVWYNPVWDAPTVAGSPSPRRPVHPLPLGPPRSWGGPFHCRRRRGALASA